MITIRCTVYEQSYFTGDYENNSDVLITFKTREEKNKFLLLFDILDHSTDKNGIDWFKLLR